MNKLLKVVIKQSCDDQFIERVAKEDPFEYWNRCIQEGTSRVFFTHFPVGGLLRAVSSEGNSYTIKVSISIKRTKDPIFNYEITYIFEHEEYVHGQASNDLLDALIMRFGYFNMTIEEIH